MNLAVNILQFGRVLRQAGLDVHHARLLDAIRALAWVDIGNRADVAATLRCLLVHDHNDAERFDRAFDLFFRAHSAPTPGLPLFSLGERPRVVARPLEGSPIHAELDEVEAASTTATRAIGAWSAASVSRTKDFGEFSERELERARTLLEKLPWTVGQRRTRRWRRARSSFGAPDLRRFLRENLMRGDLVDLPRRRRRDAARPIILLGDVSGSMERYSRMLMHFVYGLSRSAARVEVFLFATRLTRVTPYLRRARGVQALTRLGREVQDWGGGTRIGDALRTFNTHWARRVIRNGPVVLIVSDGWDRGDPAVIDRELARIHRSCRRVIWLNPLLGVAGYQPVTRGMQAALRHVDDFLPIHNLASIEQLATHLHSLSTRIPRWS
jgi:uncharacterized protein